MSDERYFYEPSQGHGLPHNPFNAIVGPRPIGWISSHSADGVLNLAPYSFFNGFNYTPPPPQVDEFQLAGLTPVASRIVKVPRVGEALVSFECRRTQIIPLQDTAGKEVGAWLVMGEVVGVHIAPHLLKDGIYDTAAAQPILRAGGPADYFEIGADTLFRMRRPSYP